MTVAPDPLDDLLRRSWHPVAMADDIRAAPVPVTLLDERLVVARLDGQIVAFDDQCRASLRPRHVAEHLGLVWVALEDPVVPLPEFPEYGDEEIRIVPCPPYDWECNATRRIENFLDFAHFPWIHPGILGDPDQPLVAPHTVERDGAVIHVHQTRIEPTNDDVKTGGLAVDGTVTTEMRYLVHLPLTAQLHQVLPGGRAYVVWLTASPISVNRTRTFWFVGRNYALDEDDDKFVRFQQDVVAQDRPVIESQRPYRIPYDLTAELHVKDDKFQLEYRRGLLELCGPLARE
jgi:phenylpropionate dioxygenase-like ring-hydroxylating dioxygenase large terminal subunit